MNGGNGNTAKDGASLPSIPNVCMAPFEACPHRDYLMSGLASSGHCPECGFEYDAESRLHLRYVGRDCIKWLVCAAVSIVLFFIFSWLRVTFLTFKFTLYVAAFTMIVGAIVFIVIAAYSVQYHKRWCMGPSACSVRSLLGKRCLPRWADVSEVRPPLTYISSASVRLIRRRGFSVSIHAGIGGRIADALDFADEANRRIHAFDHRSHIEKQEP